MKTSKSKTKNENIKELSSDAPFFQVTGKTRDLIPYVETIARIEQFKELWVGARDEIRDEVAARWEILKPRQNKAGERPEEKPQNEQGIDWAGLVNAFIDVDSDSETLRSDKIWADTPARAISESVGAQDSPDAPAEKIVRSQQMLANTLLRDLAQWIGEGRSEEVYQFAKIFTEYQRGFKTWRYEKLATLCLMTACQLNWMHGLDKWQVTKGKLKDQSRMLWAECLCRRREKKMTAANLQRELENLPEPNWRRILKTLRLEDMPEEKPGPKPKTHGIR